MSEKPKLVSLALAGRTSLAWNPQQMLEEAIRSVQAGEKTPTKAMVLLLDDKNDVYHTSYFQAGMSCSQCISLLEITKQLFLDEINGRS